MSPSSKDPASESNESVKSIAVSVSVTEATNLSSSNDSQSTDSQMNDESIPTVTIDTQIAATSGLFPPSSSSEIGPSDPFHVESYKAKLSSAVTILTAKSVSREGLHDKDIDGLIELLKIADSMSEADAMTEVHTTVFSAIKSSI